MATGVYLIDNPPATRQYRSPRRENPSGLIVVHTAEAFADETPPDRGAENVAAFIARRTNPGSYHHLADSDSIIQLVRFSDEAFHDATGSNPHSYGVSAACQAAKWSLYSQSWRNATVANMARAAARYALWVELRFGIRIPARRVTRDQSENREPGFISHAERDPARRTDPGKDFPWTFFLQQFASFSRPTPVPIPVIGGSEMALLVVGGRSRRRLIVGDRVVAPISAEDYALLADAGVPNTGVSNALIDVLDATLGAEIEDREEPA